jgi:hypothetical protein
MRRQLLGLLIVSFAFCWGSTGCGDADRGVPVTGSVTMGGQPQDAARVYFIPSDPTGDMPFIGAATDASGKFSVKLPPGKYAVTLSRKVDKSGKVPGESEDPTQDFTQLEASGLLRETIPAHYSDSQGTPLSVEIPPEGKDLEPFVVEM